MPKIAAVIMAAGKGTRMKSKYPKVMHKLAGRPMIDHVLNLAALVEIERPIVILGHGREVIERHLPESVQVAVQNEQLGTGHAVMQALPFLDDSDLVLVLSGDQPLVRDSTLRSLLKLHLDSKASATILTARMNNPYGYGRIIKAEGEFQRIVEEKDATEAERELTEINTGTYCFNSGLLREMLSQISPNNAQGEYYLTEVFSLLKAHGHRISTSCTDDSIEALGINSREQLAEAEKVLRKRICSFWMNEGVTIIDPETTFIETDVKFGRDIILHPFTFIKGETTIEDDCIIGPNSVLESCICKQGAEIIQTVAKNAIIGENCSVGPFAYLRSGTVLESGVKIGDFVEVKNSVIGTGSKVPHLSYIGDSQIGKSVNIGAGTITCNYDGKNKYPTVIEDNAFIGSNTNLVAPVKIGSQAVVGAGSTITKDVPARALAVERSNQLIKEQWNRK
ncbi:MAG: bifunctional UDP-N-acetylglucosamine diphosphorylase/glucosamine-1-phosphate N-acetyltransferase GlmU [Desulfitobacterium hafniense]|nr:bifunctional UDP-N-acetylglucosamine diphosphorylase/glucosamine-1-phosphate N-acetyltransferase GlmU [Desulfitobacterium hafniense]